MFCRRPLQGDTWHAVGQYQRRNPALDLTTLGWNPFFATYYEPYTGNGYQRARVARADRHVYVLYAEGGECSGRVSGRFRHEATRLSDYPAIGDWVAIEPHDDGETATIHAVLPRQSRFSRKVPGVVTEEQVVAANVDTVFLVSGLDLDLEPRRIERPPRGLSLLVIGL